MKLNKKLKRLLILSIAAFMMLTAVNVVNAAYVELGNPASTSYESYVPFYGFYDYGWSAVIYLQSELGGAKTFTGLTYDVYFQQVYTIYDQKIWIKHTTDTDWVGNYVKPDPVADGYTLVYEGDITFTGARFTDYIDFDTNFNYDGTDNMIIYWENWDGDYASYQPRWYYPGSSYAPNRVKYRYADGAMPGDATSASYYFPNIHIHFQTDHDVAVTDILSPGDFEGYGNVPVRVQVENVGKNTESFPVNVKINAPPVTVFTEGFEDCYDSRPLPPVGWTVEDTNGDGYTSGVYAYDMWGSYYSTSSSYVHTGTMSMRMDYKGSTGDDDWVFTDALALTAGSTYNLDFWTRVSSSSTSYDNLFEVWFGPAPISTAMTTSIFADPNYHHTAFRMDSTTFTVPSTGIYYIGFLKLSSYSYASVYLDDVSLYIPGSAIYDQTVTMTSLGVGSVSQADLPDWTVASPGIYEVVADAQLGTDEDPPNNIFTKYCQVGFVDAEVLSIDAPQSLMGPIPFSPVATVNNSGDLDFTAMGVGLLPVHATVLDPTGGTGLAFTEDFEGATSFYEFEGDIDFSFNPEDVYRKSGDYVGGTGMITWPDEKTQFGAPGDWTILNPDNNGAIWHPTTYRSSPNSPVQSMYAGDEVSKQYLPSSMDVMISPKIYVGPAGGSFGFDIFNDVEGAPYDYVLFGASPDGMTWSWWFGSSYWTSWMTASGIPILPTDVDANGYCHIGFAFFSDSSFQYEGVYIDNVEVYGSPYLYDETMYVEIDAGRDDVQVEFPLFTPLDGYDSYTLDVCVEHPNDGVPGNDCMSQSFVTNAPAYILETGLGYPTIQEAIDAAEHGQTVVASDGTWYEDLLIDKAVTVTGENIESTRYDSTCTYDHTHGSHLVGTVVIDPVPYVPTYCTWEICLRDSYGDGWNGGMVDVIVNGDVVLNDITVPSGTGPICYEFNVDDGDSIEVIWTAGSYPSENYYTIYDNLGFPVVTDWQPYYDGTWTGTGFCEDEPEGCAWEIYLYDDFGDGWDSASVDVLVNGIVVLDDVSLGSGYGPAIYPFIVEDGDSIMVTYTAGSWPSENSYDIFDAGGSPVVTFWYPYYDGTWTGTGYCPVAGPDDEEGYVIFEKFDVTPPDTFVGNDAAIKIYGSQVIVRKNTIHNILGLCNETNGNFTIKGIHVYSGDPAENFTGIYIENNTIRDILNEGTGGGGGGGGEFEFDFETDDGGWVSSADWSPYIGDWEWTNTYNVANYVYGSYATSEIPPPTANGGTGMWGTIMYAPYTNAGGRSYLSQTFDFTGLTNVQIEWYSWEQVFGSFDYCELWVNGVLEWGPSYDYSAPTWKLRTVDLSAYDGMSSVTIEFAMYATTVVNYAGWYIDDVVITAGGLRADGYYGGATGIMAQGFLEDVTIAANRVEDIHSAGWCYGVEYTPTNIPSFASRLDWIQYHDGYTENGLGLTAGGTIVEAIQLTDTELAGFRGSDMVEIEVAIGCDVYGADSGVSYEVWIDTSQPTDPTTSYIVATGTSGMDVWNSVDIEDYTIPASGDVWLGVSFTHAAGQYPMGIDETNPITQGGYFWYSGGGWLNLNTAGFPGCWGLGVAVGESGPGPATVGKINVNCNYFRGIGDGTVYPEVNDSSSAPYPGVMFTVDQAAIPGPANASWVTLRCNYFDPDCRTPIYAVINKDLANPLDATYNYWGAPDGPGGGVQDPMTGMIANGRGAHIVNYGPVWFDPWLGIHADITVPMGESISVEVGELVNFDASGSFAYCFNGCEECCSPSPQTMQYLWDFDDGRYSANKMCTHVFQQPGTYQVSLMVDTFGFPYFNNFMYDWDYIEVVVVEQGQPLTANADGGNLGGYETIIEVPVTFHGSASGGKAPYYYSWDFGDGTSTQITSKDAATVQHSYYVPGTYTVTLTVMDSNGDRSTDTSTVLVHDVQELVVNVGGSTHVVEGDVASFTSQVSGGNIPYSYHWDFGDGVISNIANPTHVYESSGMYTVTLTVTDGREVQKIKTRTITVSPTETSEVEISNVKSGLFLSAIIDSDAEVAWSIDVDGLVLFGGHADGTAQGNTQIKLPFSLGFGSVDITITAGSAQKQYTATMIGPFLFKLQEA